MPNTRTYPEIVARARARGTYEHLRAPLQRLVDAGYTRRELPEMLRIGSTTVELALAVLQISTHGKPGRPGRDDTDDVRELAAQRAQEHHWVKLFRDTYGPIGKGFSTA